MKPKELSSEEETISFGRQLKTLAKPSTIFCFTGDLGAGKTTMIKGLISELTGTPINTIISPTFVYLNIYSGITPVYHFDLYRLSTADEFLAMGFEEMMLGEGITCIEWPERIQEILPSSCVWVQLSYSEKGGREVMIADGKTF